MVIVAVFDVAVVIAIEPRCTLLTNPALISKTPIGQGEIADILFFLVFEISRISKRLVRDYQ